MASVPKKSRVRSATGKRPATEEARRGAGRAQPKHSLVTACLITKDEEENLPGCLAAARRIADDVVVYDTGSTDATVAIARQWGARVIEGYWDDDFARARNAALAECRGDWILWVDADEVFECDEPRELRRLLRATKDEIDAWSVPIWNLTGAGVGAGFTHHAARLFRRRRCEWVGRIHEQVTRRHTRAGITQAVLEIGRIRHTGYLDSAMIARNKADRNIRVAEREVAEADGWELGQSLTSLGRSSLIAGRFHEAIAHCTEALEHTDNGIVRRLAMRTCAEAHLSLQRIDEAEAWMDEIAVSGSSQVQATVLRARVALARGEHASALALLDEIVPGSSDEDGFIQSAAMLAPLRADALVGMGRYSEAADALIGVLREEGVLDTHLGTVVDYLDRAKRPLEDLASAVPAGKAESFLAQLRQLHVDVADRLLDSLWEQGRVRPLAILATAAGFASQLSIERAMVWSVRFRQAGIVDACPLVAHANDPLHAPLHQARAAVTGWRMFADTRLRERFYTVYVLADAQARAQMLAEALALCPELVGRHADGRIMAAAVSVSIVVPCLNQAEATLRLLQSIAAHTAPDTYQVILVDRGSTDAMTALRGDPGNLALVVLDAGWGADLATAIAVGASAAGNDLLVLLDQQSEVLPGWLPPLVDMALRVGAQGRVVPCVLSPTGTARGPQVVDTTALALPMVVGSAQAARGFLRTWPVEGRRTGGDRPGDGREALDEVVEVPESYLVTGGVRSTGPNATELAQVLGSACR